MPNQKISALTSAASAQASTLYPVVSGQANKSITQHTMLKSLGVAQYVETTVRTTATVAFVPLSNISDIYIKALVGSSAADGGSVVNIGIGTDATYFGTMTTSGRGFYRPVDVSARNLQAVSGAIIACAPSATANASFVVGIGYFRV